MTVTVIEETVEPEDVVDTTLETAIVIAEKIDDARKEGENEAKFQSAMTESQFNEVISYLGELRSEIANLASVVSLIGEATADLIDDTTEVLEEVEEVVEEVEETTESPDVVEEVAVVTPEAPQPRQKKARRWL